VEQARLVLYFFINIQAGVNLMKTTIHMKTTKESFLPLVIIYINCLLFRGQGENALTLER
jgi:hypothetical protein